MQTQTMEQALLAIDANGQALKLASELIDENAVEKLAADKMIPGLVDQLVACRLIEDHERPYAVEKLATHNGAVTLIGNLLQHLQTTKTAHENQLRAAGNGVPVSEPETTKSASTTVVPRRTSNSSPFIGRRPGLGEKRASETAFAEAILGSTNG